MRDRIGRWLFTVAMIALFVLAGVLIASGADWMSWVLWALAWPALLVVCSFIMKPRGKAVNETGHPAKAQMRVVQTPDMTLPRFGQMRGNDGEG